MNYKQYIESKVVEVPPSGFETDNLSPALKPHQQDTVRWALSGGKRAIFCSFGLGKTVMQLEIARQVIRHTGKPFLIGLPLGVLGEFKDDAKNILNTDIRYVRSMEEVYAQKAPGICASNYERIREGCFDPHYFGGVSFDEGDAIRNLDTKTADYIIRKMAVIPFRFIATATPTPNEYTEILNYAQFLGIMDRGQALTRFFQRNSTTAGNLTLYPHKEEEFWLWVRSWAIFIEYPSDLGYSDEGYKLPNLHVHLHEISVEDRAPIIDRDGQRMLFGNSVKSLSEAAREKRESLLARVEKAVNLVNLKPDKHWLIWHDLEDERRVIERLLPGSKSVYGGQKNELKEALLSDFKQGKYPYLATKPVIAGAGCNFQKFCHQAVFVGIGYKFKVFIQAIHRIVRFCQKEEVNIHLVYTDAEREVLSKLMEKWDGHKKLIRTMTDLMRRYGLSQKEGMLQLKGRCTQVERKEASGRYYQVVCNDSVEEVKMMPDNSVGMVLTSIPFSDQYEYCENYRDFGHNDGNDGFFKQMDFLTPELLRVTMPGRVACIHVKDRIRFSYQNGVGFTSLIDFSGLTVQHFIKHGWHLLGKHFITTDVVRENAQTYRLGWTEQCKDATKMGSGSPEYLLVFRKPPTDRSNAYSDIKVEKDKRQYTRARWQMDAHAHWSSAGNRLLTPDELRDQNLGHIGKWWKDYCAKNPYDYERHVQLCETLDNVGKLPSSFMAVPPRSLNAWVWDDISRLKTLNAELARKKKEKHLCPLQFDIVDRAIIRYSNEGDTIYDPFGGVGTVPYRCITLKRKGISTELNESYWKDSVAFCKAQEAKGSTPTLFDILKTEAI